MRRIFENRTTILMKPSVKGVLQTKNKVIKMIALILGSMFLMIGLTACEDNPVMKFVIDNQPYEEQAALEQAETPAEFAA